jgi:hypothetical protein
VKQKTKGKSNKIGPVYDKKGNLHSTKKSMANAFGEHLGEELKPGLTFTELQSWEQRRKTFDHLPFNIIDPTTSHYPDWFTPHPESPEQVLIHKQLYISPKMVKDQIRKAKRNSAP